MTLQFGDQIGYSKIKLRTDLSYTVYGASICFELFTPTVAYCGERFDTQSQLYFLGNGHRVYNSRLMRFHTPDAHSPFLQGGINIHCYCKNDPVNFLDPTGKTRTPLKSVSTSTRHRGFNSALHRDRGFRQIQKPARAGAREALATARQASESADALFEREQTRRAQGIATNDPSLQEVYNRLAGWDRLDALQELERSRHSRSVHVQYAALADTMAEARVNLRRSESENFPLPRVHSPAPSVQTSQVITTQSLATLIRRTTVIGVSSGIRRNNQP